MVAEGPHLRVYNRLDNTCICSHRVFRDQAIHGISKLDAGVEHLHLIVWGGIQVRTIKISYKCNEDDHDLDYSPGIILNALSESNEARAPDWILDICPSPASQEQQHPGRCVAVTAHNALLEIAVQQLTSEGPPAISVKALTSSTRSILYSAHLQWESETRVLVAAGTAFGEIIYWSWDQSRDSKTRSLVHRVFLGHEGSIFGVQISGILTINRHGPRRLLASCSDDRTIRIWDVTDVAAELVGNSHEDDSERQRTRHTGFSNGSFDPDMSNTDCLAIGWGHTSRVWNLSFLTTNRATDQSLGDVFLISSGEDATSRTWRLITEAYEPLSRPNATVWQLKLVSTAAHHNGKNIWSMSMSASASDEIQQYVTIGGADSKITRFSLPPSLFSGPTDMISDVSRPRIRDITELGSISTGIGPDEREVSHRSSKQAEFFRSYAFLDESSLIFTTNSGKVYLENLSPHIDGGKNDATSSLQFIDQLEDLCGYSVCAGEQSYGVAFVAGSRGTLYMYRKGTDSLVKVNTFNGKIGEVFPSLYQSTSGAKEVVLLITLVGQKVAQLLYIDIRASDSLTILEKINVPIMDQKTGLAITSMSHIHMPAGKGILLGFRRGSIAAYSIPKRSDSNNEDVLAELIQIIHSAHGKEAVTAMAWNHKDRVDQFGYLTSTGRDSCVVTHRVDLVKHAHQLVHHLTLPIGPNIEGIHIHRNQLHVYGFSSKKFVLYNTITEKEVMSVETGGAHRTWSFNPTLLEKDGGTLVWTRASSMHTFSQGEPNHTVIRSGGHGREIKAVAVSRPTSMQESGMQLIATGAEDTDIKIFNYVNEHLVCLRTLRRHTTGIQCLQWSTDGSYLFSSGGCEEFYIWRISRLPPELGSIGVVCEAVWSPESEHSDLRIMAIDVAQKADHAFVISMVFSNSTVKVYIDNRVLLKGTNQLCRSTTLIPRGQTDGRRWQRAYTLLPVSPNAYLSIHQKWKYLIPSSQLEQTAMLCFGP